MKHMSIRHGEIVLKKTSVDMSGAKSAHNYVVGHSETGHHHVLAGKCAVLEREGRDAVVCLEKPTVLKHKKEVDRHDDVVVPAGTYRILRKTEYDPFARILREVRD